LEEDEAAETGRVDVEEEEDAIDDDSGGTRVKEARLTRIFGEGVVETRGEARDASRAFSAWANTSRNDLKR